jgi:SWI/SNF-related matrix-associated actin-dependent regulator of chromatin subfamily A3
MMELSHKINHSIMAPIQGHTQLKIIKPEAQFVIAFPDDTVLGEVNAQLEKALVSITEQGYQLDFEVFAPVRAIQETLGRATKEKEAVVRVQINVYGARSIAHDIGKDLSDQKIYLQRPGYVRGGTTYENPHVLTLTGFQYSTTDITTPLEDTTTEKTTTETLKSTIKEVYSSLTRDQNLRGLEGDERLNTSLLLHQKTALAFMMQRENGPIPDEYKLWRSTEIEGVICYRHVVTNTRCMMEPVETGGGILADEMGMGKTLSILALILRTLDAAHLWAASVDAPDEQEALGQWRHRQRSAATLIVASSDRMFTLLRHRCTLLTVMQ